MPSDKTVNSRKPIRRSRRVNPVRADLSNMPPVFLTVKLRRAVERLLPAEHYQRLHRYFETYGCLHCSRKNVVYGANGFCRLCISMIGKRIRKIDTKLRARKSTPLPNFEETYLRPYNSARKLLADLIPRIDNGLIRKKPDPKHPAKVYLRF